MRLGHVLMWQFRGRERTTMEGRTMATANASLLNSAMASSVSILVNVYVFTWPLCRRYSFACAQELIPSQQCFSIINGLPLQAAHSTHRDTAYTYFLDLWSFIRESKQSQQGRTVLVAPAPQCPRSSMHWGQAWVVAGESGWQSCHISPML